MEIPGKIWFLMSRSLSGEATPAEREELMQQLQEQPVLMQQYEMMKRMWQGYAGRQEPGPEETGRVSRILQLAAAEEALHDNDSLHDSNTEDDNQHEITTAPPRVIRRRAWNSVYGRVAIAAGLAAGLWALAHWYRDSHRSGSRSEIIAERGSKTRTILPDGSTVWLNAGSRIRYEPGFNGVLREVTLQGEAFFDVVQQPSRPFIVHAGDLNIKVLGTAFNVKSYDEDPTVETTLIRGLVQISRPGDSKQTPIYLYPHQKIVLARKDTDEPVAAAVLLPGVQTNAPRSHIIEIDSSMKEDERVETSWVYNRLEFRGDSFSELARKLERWYNIDIHFEDEAARTLTFNGSLENETVEQAFLALEAAVPFHFTIKNNEVYIKAIEKPVSGLAH
jgi:ferric-dicitrate binding protein FerR (iron transport regulator)